MKHPILLSLLLQLTAFSLTALSVDAFEPEFNLSKPGEDSEFWSLVVLPDTQYYPLLTQFDGRNLFRGQTEWIRNHADALNIRYVLHLGDIVQNNGEDEWIIAREAMEVLHGVVPYAASIGNHDVGDIGKANNRKTLFTDFFPVEEFRQSAAFGGLMEPDSMDNTYSFFEAGGEQWLVLALEFFPRDAVLEWANAVLANHPGHRAIIITHAYLRRDGERLSWPAEKDTQGRGLYNYGIGDDPEGANDGEEIWQKLARYHPNLEFVFCGHITGVTPVRERGLLGNPVDQILVNYQGFPDGGTGFLQILRFYPDGRVLVQSYSPVHDRFLPNSEGFTHQFELQREAPLHNEGSGQLVERIPSPYGLDIVRPLTSDESSTAQLIRLDSLTVEGAKFFPAGAWSTAHPFSVLDERSLEGNLKGNAVIGWKGVWGFPVHTRHSVGGHLIQEEGEFWEDILAARGTRFVLRAVPEPGFRFGGWRGSVASGTDSVSFTVSGPMEIEAVFLREGSTPDLTPYRVFRHEAGDQPFPYWRGLHRWENAQRDARLPGTFRFLSDPQGNPVLVEDSGQSSNAWNPSYTSGTARMPRNHRDFVEIPSVPFAGYDGARYILRDSGEMDLQSGYTFEGEASFGSRFGTLVYWNYKDELNFYRLTLVSQVPAPETGGAFGSLLHPRNAPLGINIEKRVQGHYTVIHHVPDGLALDPAGRAGFNRIHFRVTTAGADHQIRLSGLSEGGVTGFGPEWTFAFSDQDIPEGKPGFGTWRQSGTVPGRGAEEFPEMGTAFHRLVLTNRMDGRSWAEDWRNAHQGEADFLEQLGQPLKNGSAASGSWSIAPDGAVHGPVDSVAETFHRPGSPRIGVDSPVFLLHTGASVSRSALFGLQAFDLGAMGVVYAFEDSANYIRILLNGEPEREGGLPLGLTVERKTPEGWQTLVQGDRSFLPWRGTPMGWLLEKRETEVILSVYDWDTHELLHTYHWNDGVRGSLGKMGFANLNLGSAARYFAFVPGL